MCFVRDTRDNTENYKQKRNDATICINKKRKMVSNEIVSLQNKNYTKKRRKFHKNSNYLSRQYKPINRNNRK